MFVNRVRISVVPETLSTFGTAQRAGHARRARVEGSGAAQFMAATVSRTAESMVTPFARKDASWVTGDKRESSIGSSVFFSPHLFTRSSGVSNLRVCLSPEFTEMR